MMVRRAAAQSGVMRSGEYLEPSCFRVADYEVCYVVATYVRVAASWRTVTLGKSSQVPLKVRLISHRCDLATLG